jgi:hypothetical protein
MDPYLIPGKSFLRLWKEYKQYGKLIIAYDFDNTVFDYHNKGHTHKFLINLLRRLKNIGCSLTCWTSNPDLNFVESYLKNNEIPFDFINKQGIDLGWKSSKPFFSAVLDDRCGLLQVYLELLLVTFLVK